jgi:curved DNA-binding protein CbpA
MGSNQIDPTAGDYYSRLGLSPDASADEIRTAAKKAISQYHPDNDDTVDSNKKLYYRVKDAKDTLEDSNDRRYYDVFYEYSKGNTAYTTELYEQWCMKSQPRRAISWIEDNFDPDAASETDESKPIDELIDGYEQDEEPSNEGDDKSSSKIEGEGDEEDGDTNDDIKDTIPSPTPIDEEDDQDKGESGEDNQDEEENEGDAHFDQQDTGYTDPTPDDDRDSGLDGSDLKYIQNKMNNPIVLGNSENVFVGDDNQSIVLRDSFRQVLKINFTTGRLSAPQTLSEPVTERFLTKVYAHVDRGEGVLHIGYAKDSVDNVEVILNPDSYFGSGDDADDSPSGDTSDDSGVPSNYEYTGEDGEDESEGFNNRSGGKRRSRPTGGKKRPSDERTGREGSSEKSGSPNSTPSYNSNRNNRNKGDPNTTIQNTSPSSRTSNSTKSDDESLPLISQRVVNVLLGVVGTAAVVLTLFSVSSFSSMSFSMVIMLTGLLIVFAVGITIGGLAIALPFILIYK